MERKSQKKAQSTKKYIKNLMKRQKQNLKQENCGVEAKTRKNAVYICKKCTISSETNTAIQYTRCNSGIMTNALSTAFHCH